MRTILLTVLSTLWIATAHADIQDIFPNLVETQSIGDSTSVGIDPSLLTFSYGADVTVYFISEGAGYKNSLGWYDASTDPTLAENRNLIWNNASGAGNGLAGGGTLNSGDSVDLGTFEAGSSLGFYLAADGANKSNPYYYFTDIGFNPDGIEHVVAGLLPEEGLLAIGFEDLFGGGDMDYNDLIIAIDIGVENALQIAAAAPEPEIWLMILIGLLGLYLKNQQALLINKEPCVS